MAKFTTIIGDGSSTIFDLEVGFQTGLAVTRLYDDTHGGAEVQAYSLFRQVPTPTSIRLQFTPPPAVAAIMVKVSDGTEVP